MASVCAVTADRRIVNIWAAVLLMVKIQAPVALDYLEVGSLLEGHDLVGLDDARRPSARRLLGLAPSAVRGVRDVV